MGWAAGGEGCPNYNGGWLWEKMGTQIIMEGGWQEGRDVQITIEGGGLWEPRF